MKRTVANSKHARPQPKLPRPVAGPDGFSLRQLDEAMKWLRETKRERKLTHALLPVS